MIDSERAAGNTVDLPAIVKKVYFEGGPQSLLK